MGISKKRVVESHRFCRLGEKDEIKRNVDFKEERYLQIGGSHKFIY